MSLLTIPEALPTNPALYQEAIAALAADMRGPLYDEADQTPSVPYVFAGKLVELLATSDPSVIAEKDRVSGLGTLGGISIDLQLGTLGDEHMQHRHSRYIQQTVDYFRQTGLLTASWVEGMRTYTNYHAESP